ncbi:MAG: hypothetical protein ABH950_08560 [Candidatus Altiarchaeota archaeon]
MVKKKLQKGIQEDIEEVEQILKSNWNGFGILSGVKEKFKRDQADGLRY